MIHVISETRHETKLAKANRFGNPAKPEWVLLA